MTIGAAKRAEVAGDTDQLPAGEGERSHCIGLLRLAVAERYRFWIKKDRPFGWAGATLECERTSPMAWLGSLPNCNVTPPMITLSSDDRASAA